ncbi:hypothetical protein [Nocardia sp. NPDC049526]|uniref:hypothetical protein n=1 Tax=Nocardia sp. NPDC049526 TaxID=3364316 RepID=UPI0037BCBF5E
MPCLSVPAARSGPREVVTEPQAPYFGAVLEQASLLPGEHARVAQTRLSEWSARR